VVVVSKRMSLLALCVERTGSNLRGARLAAFIVWWGTARRELGRDMTIEEYVAWSRESRATAYRELALFRDAFAPLETPHEVLDYMERHGLGELVDPVALSLA